MPQGRRYFAVARFGPEAQDQGRDTVGHYDATGAGNFAAVVVGTG